ncbi:MAG: phosphotransferase family protein [Pseudonocardiaceae bacterium]
MTDLADGLSRVMSRAWQRPTTVDQLRRLSGGASMETWSFVAHSPEPVRLILRKDRPGTPVGSVTREQEARLIVAAARAGVPVPRLITAGDGDALGAAYLITEFLDGETIPRRILRDDVYQAARPRIVHQVAAAMARVHQVPPPEVSFLGPPREPESLVRDFAAGLEHLGDPSPALELGVRWLLRHLPPAVPPALVHGDLRNGNLIVGPDGMRAVLDWELAHLGDPAEDLGWFCVRAWRFGVDERPAGGFGSRRELLGAYVAAGGRPVEDEVMHFWEVFGTLKWGVVCMSQAAAHLRGGSRSVELAAIGRRVAETEYDLLALLEEGRPEEGLLEEGRPEEGRPEEGH